MLQPALAPRTGNGYSLDEYAPYEDELELVRTVALLGTDGEEVAKREPFQGLIQVRALVLLSE